MGSSQLLQPLPSRVQEPSEPAFVMSLCLSTLLPWGHVLLVLSLALPPVSLLHTLVLLPHKLLLPSLIPLLSLLSLH